MHHDFLDQFSRRASPIHRLSVYGKVWGALLLIGISVLLPITFWYIFTGIAVVLLVTAIVSTVPIKFILKRILFFEPFVIFVATLTLLQHGGVIKFSSIIVKSTLSLITVILLSNTTPFTELLRFLKRIHTPSVFVTIVALMYRYLFILVDEMERIQRARQSRTFKKGISRSWYVLSTVLGQLFLRSTERAERIYAAMCARGWK